MTEKDPTCTGDCEWCSGIHVAVPDNVVTFRSRAKEILHTICPRWVRSPRNDLHLLRMSRRFVDGFVSQKPAASLTLRLGDLDSMYARGTRDQLLSQAPDIKAVALQLGWQMHSCLNGAED